jgi:hypothetical protein
MPGVLAELLQRKSVIPVNRRRNEEKRMPLRSRTFLTVVLSLLALFLALSPQAAAAAVGRFTQVEGRVDLLKGGKLPAISVKSEDPVELGDIVRTKSLSKAQLTFVDNSVVTISPESRLAIEQYLFDPAKGKRNAVLQLFQGLAYLVVSKLHKVEEPDFVVKTHTAIMGIRGTEVGIRLAPNSSTFLNFKGRTCVNNAYPEVAGTVCLNAMQGTAVQMGLPPTLPFEITAEDRKMFMNHLATGVQQLTGSKQSVTPAPVASSLAGGSLASAATVPGEVFSGSIQTQALLAGLISIPPQAQPPTSLLTTPFFIQIMWGLGGVDLDLHLTGPLDNSRFHVYYANPGSLTAQPYALLGQDYTSVGGSEVISVGKLNLGGVYRASVYNYGDPSFTSTNLSTTSGVSMQVIKGGNIVNTPAGGGGTSQTISGGKVLANLTPTAGLPGNTWRAVEINPANGQINKVNQILNSANSGSVQ